MSEKNEIPVNEISQMMDMISEKIPTMLSQMLNTAYSVETAEKIGLALGSMYKNLIESGMDKREAFIITKDYLNMMKEFFTDQTKNVNPKTQENKI